MVLGYTEKRPIHCFLAALKFVYVSMPSCSCNSLVRKSLLRKGGAGPASFERGALTPSRKSLRPHFPSHT